MRRLAIAIIFAVAFSSCADAATRMLLQAPQVTATLLLSRAGKSDRCVASISLRGAYGKPLPTAAAAKVQWAGEAAPQAIATGTNAPGRLFTTSSNKQGAAGCQVQVLEVTVAGIPAALTTGSVLRRQITW